MSVVTDFKKQYTQVSKDVEKIEDEIAEKKKEIEKLKKEELGIREGVTPESEEEWIETQKNLSGKIDSLKKVFEDTNKIIIIFFFFLFLYFFFLFLYFFFFLKINLAQWEAE
jgi:predicted PurR-regulated permease PerM